MTIQEAHTILDFQLNKEINGYLSPEQKDLVLNRAQLAEYLDLAGDESDFQPGAAIAQKGYGKAGWIDDELQIFLVAAPLSAAAEGILTLPADYFRGEALAYQSGKPINVLTADKLPHRRESVIRQYNSKNQAGLYSGGQILLNPPRAADVTLYYLRYPAEVVFSYTIVGRVVTYDPGSSVDPEWSDKSMERIINRAISLAGDHLDAASKIQYAEAKTQQGL